MSNLILIESIDAFKEIKDFPSSKVLNTHIDTIKSLDEREEIEPFIRTILFDSNSTAHGPAELVDILTHKVTINNETGIAGFIIKGKSFPTVRPTHVSHQIYRLEKIEGLKLAILATSGNVLDQAKEQFCSTAERIGCKYAIFDAHDLARLFIAYGFLCPRDSNRIIAGRCSCGYSPQKRFLNILQVESLKALNNSHKIGQRSGVIILPTGTGKTRIAAEDAKSFQTSNILYIAHTHEILDVAQSEFEAVFNIDNVQQLDKKNKINDPLKVNISTIQFLKRNLEFIPKDFFSYLIIDEFHHAAAKSYRQLIEHIKPAYLLGLTATPFRNDRQDILEICDNNVLVNFELRTGIDSGILSPYHYFGCFDDIDYSKIHHNGTRYDIKDLEKSLIIESRDASIIAKYKEMAEDKPTIAFCCSHNHAVRVAKSFNKANIPAAVYLSNTKQNARKEILRKFSRGKIKIICVVDVFNEGVDIPFVECLLFLRPTESKRIFYQQLGRGLRRFTGKSHCIVIDFIGNFKNAYKIVEYQGLLPLEGSETSQTFTRIHSIKEIFNLPLGCQVHFDDKIIDIFTNQTLDPRNATRYNIGRILIYQYHRLMKRLEHFPSKIEVDRYLILDSSLYVLVFGSWKNFESIIREQFSN